MTEVSASRCPGGAVGDQYASNIPRSTSGSPSALISQSKTATMRPTSIGSNITLSSLKSPWTIAGWSGFGGSRAISHSATASISGSGAIFDPFHRLGPPTHLALDESGGPAERRDGRRSTVDGVQIARACRRALRSDVAAQPADRRSQAAPQSRTTRPRRRSIT